MMGPLWRGSCGRVYGECFPFIPYGSDAGQWESVELLADGVLVWDRRSLLMRRGGVFVPSILPLVLAILGLRLGWGMVWGMKESLLRRENRSGGVPSIYELKPRFQQLLRPFVRWLAGIGVTANQVTLGAVVMSVVVGGVIGIWPERVGLLMMLPVALFVRMALNAVDGMLAREHGMQSRLGAVLNELGDVVSDVALYLPVARVMGVEAVWIVLVVVLAVMTEMAGGGAVPVGGSRRYDGPMGKSDRAFAFGVLGAILGAGFPGGEWVSVYLLVLAGLSVWTVVRRCCGALREGGVQ